MTAKPDFSIHNPYYYRFSPGSKGGLNIEISTATPKVKHEAEKGNESQSQMISGNQENLKVEILDSSSVSTTTEVSSSTSSPTTTIPTETTKTHFAGIKLATYRAEPEAELYIEPKEEHDMKHEH